MSARSHSKHPQTPQSSPESPKKKRSVKGGEGASAQRGEETLPKALLDSLAKASREGVLDVLLERFQSHEHATQKAISDLWARLERIATTLEGGGKSADQGEGSRYEAIEGAVRHIIEHIEMNERRTRDALKTIYQKMTDGVLPAGGTEKVKSKKNSLEAEISEVLKRLEVLEKAQGGAAQAGKAKKAQDPSVLEAVHSLEVSHAKALEEINDRVALLIDREIARVETALKALLQENQSTFWSRESASYALEQIQSEMTRLNDQLDALEAEAALKTDVGEVRSLIEGLGKSLPKAEGLPSSYEDILKKTNELEAEIRHVSNLQSLQQHALQQQDQTKTVDALKNKMHAFEDRLETVEGKLEPLENLEATIHDICKGLLRQDVSSDATIDRITNDVVSHLKNSGLLQGVALDGKTQDHIHLLESGLAAVQVSTQAADRRTQDILGIIHDTLEQIVEKLSRFEQASPGAPGNPAPRHSSHLAGEKKNPLLSVVQGDLGKREFSPQEFVESLGNGDLDGDALRSWKALSSQGGSAEEKTDLPEDVLSRTSLSWWRRWLGKRGEKAEQLGEKDLTMALLSESQGALTPHDSETSQGDLPDPRTDFWAKEEDFSFSLEGLREKALSPDASSVQNPELHGDFIAAARKAAQVYRLGDKSDLGGEVTPGLSSAFGKKVDFDALWKSSHTLFSKKRLVVTGLVLLAIASAYLVSLRREQSGAVPVEPYQEMQVPEKTGGLDSSAPLVSQGQTHTQESSLSLSEGHSSGVSPDLSSAPLSKSVFQKSLSTLQTGSIEPPKDQDRLLLQRDSKETHSHDLTASSLLEGTPFGGAAFNPGAMDSSLASVVAQAPLPANDRLALLQKASSGDKVSQFIVAASLFEGKMGLKDASKAAYWYQKSADQGFAPAQYRIATLYEQGQGVEKNPVLAREFYERAAAQGNVRAMHNLGVLYSGKALGVPDLSKAVSWFRQAAEYGVQDSQYNIALLYERGVGVEKNIPEAFFWYAVAARQGDGDAKARMALIEGRFGKILQGVKARLEVWKPRRVLEQANVVSVDQKNLTRVLPSEPGLSLGRDLEKPKNVLSVSSAPIGPLVEEERIRRVQTRLMTLGYDVGTVDGKMGPRTADALRLFQLRSGLTVNGRLSSDVLEQLSL